MTVRRSFAAALALLLLLGAAGCGGSDPVALGAETDDSMYKQAKQLQRQGRDSEALTAFLKVIETRGDRESAESHLEAGLIYLRHIKDPIEAIHHFRKYREYKPTSSDAPRVGELIKTAQREFVRTIPARPLEDQSLRLDNADAVERLQRENEELRAQLATLRGGGAVASRTPSLPPGSSASRSPNSTYAANNSPMINLPPPPRAAPNEQPVLQAAPVNPAPPPTATRPAPTRPATPTGRVHNVAAKDSLWSIARQHYGATVNSAKVRGIYEANRNVMKDEGDLRPGMTLRIP